ncbi:glycerol acyltransferase [Bacteroidia bacterium]|nr:glycerol acyltransferase [Bacteroidia bacterium]
MFLWLLLAVLAGLLVFSASRISFVEDISSFLPNNADNKRINEAYQKIGAANKILVTFSQKDRTIDLDVDLLTDAATRFAEILLGSDNAVHIKELMYEIDGEKMSEVTDFITQNLPYFLEEADYTRIDSLIQLQNIENLLKADKELLMSPMGGFVRNVILNDPLHFSQNALKNLEVFKQNDNYNTDNGFLFNAQGECIVTITSKYPVSETANNKLLANEIYQTVNQTKSEFNNEINIVPFGAALISITNAGQIKSDSIFAVSVAMILILALLFYFFRNFKSLFFIAVSVVFGALFSLGVIVFFKSTVSIIAVGIASIIFGIAINYPLHFLAHFRHNSNVKLTIKEIVNPLLIGNITTVGAFLALLFISSPAMHDLGLFSSFLLVGTIVFVLIFLPQFLTTRHSREGGNLLKNQEIASQARNDGHIFTRLSEFSPEKNKWIVLIFLVFTMVLFFFSFGTKFETNLQAINYMTDEQRTEMNKLIEENKGKGKTLYVVAEGQNVDDALVNYNFVLGHLNFFQEHRPNYVKNYSGIGNFFPSKDVQKEKIERWNSFWEWNGSAEHDCSKKDLFTGNLKALAKKQGFNENVFDNFISLLNTDFQPQNFEYFTPVFKNMGENYFSISDDKILIYTILNCDEGQKQTIENQITENNPYVFAFDDTSIGKKMVDALSLDFNNVLYICAFIVFIFLFFSFGRIEIAILTFIPMAVGWVWILGLMNIFDLKFNIVNIILATFIFGQGDDYTIFVTEGLIYEYTYRKKMLASFKNSIILSATILFIAIGMLIFAKHPAMRSLAELTIVGMISVVACAYLLPPLIYKWLVYKKGKNRIMPVTLWNLSKTVFSFIIFFICSIIVTLAGFFILTIGGKSKRHKLLYHRFLCNGFRILAKLMPQVKHKIHNLSGENFEKPAIIICNHQSHLDLLYTLMLSPKMITLTNKWVWNSPFYGWIIRYADFLPVADGIEQHADTLKKFVDDGYSILVFPEGTRSVDCSINRFHKGAFYLAEKLNLDILSVIIHGIGHVFPKQEFILRKGEVNIEICERQNLLSFKNLTGLNDNLPLLETAKHFRRFYQEKYSELAKKIETPEYFKDLVLKNYIYKGATIERNAKKRLKKHNNFAEEIEKLPETGEITITNSGQGEFALMAALVRKNLKIKAIEPDLDKLEIARNCVSKPANLEFYNYGA